MPGDFVGEERPLVRKRIVAIEGAAFDQRAAFEKVVQAATGIARGVPVEVAVHDGRACADVRHPASISIDAIARPAPFIILPIFPSKLT